LGGVAGGFGARCKSGQDGVDDSAAEVAIEGGAAEQQAVEDGPDQEFVDQADVGVWAQVAAGDATLDHGRQPDSAGLDHLLAVDPPQVSVGGDL
jgi:hypothetical protein